MKINSEKQLIIYIGSDPSIINDFVKCLFR
jgi:hypothetical protein